MTIVLRIFLNRTLSKRPRPDFRTDNGPHLLLYTCLAGEATVCLSYMEANSHHLLAVRPSEDYRNFSLIMIRTRVSQESEHQVPRAAGAHLYFPSWLPTSIPLDVSLQLSPAFLSDNLLSWATISAIPYNAVSFSRLFPL